MIGLGYTLAFMLGGSIGFVLACIIAAGRVAQLTRENQILRKELKQYERAFEVAAEQRQVITTLKTGTES
jgi:hypothetical protein